MNRRRSVAPNIRRRIPAAPNPPTTPQQHIAVKERASSLADVSVSRSSTTERQLWLKRHLAGETLAPATLLPPVGHALSTSSALSNNDEVVKNKGGDDGVAPSQRLLTALLDLNLHDAPGGLSFWQQALELASRQGVQEHVVRRVLREVFIDARCGNTAACLALIGKAVSMSPPSSSVHSVDTVCAAVEAIFASLDSPEGRGRDDVMATDAQAGVDTAVGLVAEWLDNCHLPPPSPTATNDAAAREEEEEIVKQGAAAVKLLSTLLEHPFSSYEERLLAKNGALISSSVVLEKLCNAAERWSMHSQLAAVPRLQRLLNIASGSVAAEDVAKLVSDVLDDDFRHSAEEDGVDTMKRRKSTSRPVYALWWLMMHLLRFRDDSSITTVLSLCVHEGSDRLLNFTMRLMRSVLLLSPASRRASEGVVPSVQGAPNDDVLLPSLLQLYCERLVPVLAQRIFAAAGGGAGGGAFVGEDELQERRSLLFAVVVDALSTLSSQWLSLCSANDSSSVALKRWCVQLGIALSSAAGTPLSPSSSWKQFADLERSREAAACFFAGLLLVREEEGRPEEAGFGSEVHCRALWHWWATGGSERILQWVNLYGQQLVPLLTGEEAPLEEEEVRLKAILAVMSVLTKQKEKSMMITRRSNEQLWACVSQSINKLMDDLREGEGGGGEGSWCGAEELVCGHVVERLLTTLTLHIRQTSTSSSCGLGGDLKGLRRVVRVLEPFCSGPAVLQALSRLGQPIPLWALLLLPKAQAKSLGADPQLLGRLVWSPAHRGHEWAIASYCLSLMERHRVRQTVEQLKTVAAALVSPARASAGSPSSPGGGAMVVFHWQDTMVPSVVATTTTQQQVFDERGGGGGGGGVVNQSIVDHEELRQLSDFLTKATPRQTTAGSADRMAALGLLRQLVMGRAKPLAAASRVPQSSPAPISGLHWTEALGRFPSAARGISDAQDAGEVLRVCTAQGRWEAASAVLRHLLGYNKKQQQADEDDEGSSSTSETKAPGVRLFTLSRSTLGRAVQLISSVSPPSVCWWLTLSIWQRVVLDRALPTRDVQSLATPLLNRTVLYALRKGHQWRLSLQFVDCMSALRCQVDFAHAAEVLSCCLGSSAPLRSVQLCLARHLPQELLTQLVCVASATTAGGGGGVEQLQPSHLSNTNCGAAELLLTAVDSQSRLGKRDAWTVALSVLRDALRGGHVSDDGECLVSPRSFSAATSALLHAGEWARALQLLNLQLVLRVDIHSSILHRILQACSADSCISIATWAHCLTIYNSSRSRVPSIHQLKVFERVCRILGHANQLGCSGRWKHALDYSRSFLVREGGGMAVVERSSSNLAHSTSASVCESLLLDRGVPLECRVDARRALSHVFPVSTHHALSDPLLNLCEDLMGSVDDAEEEERVISSSSSSSSCAPVAAIAVAQESTMIRKRQKKEKKKSNAMRAYVILIQSFKQLRTHHHHAPSLPTPLEIERQPEEQLQVLLNFAKTVMAEKTTSSDHHHHRIACCLLQTVIATADSLLQRREEESSALSSEEVQRRAVVVATAAIDGFQLLKKMTSGSDIARRGAGGCLEGGVPVPFLRCMTRVYRAAGDTVAADAIASLVTLL